LEKQKTKNKKQKKWRMIYGKDQKEKEANGNKRFTPLGVKLHLPVLEVDEPILRHL